MSGLDAFAELQVALAQDDERRAKLLQLAELSGADLGSLIALTEAVLAKKDGSPLQVDTTVLQAITKAAKRERFRRHQRPAPAPKPFALPPGYIASLPGPKALEVNAMLQGLGFAMEKIGRASIAGFVAALGAEVLVQFWDSIPKVEV